MPKGEAYILVIQCDPLPRHAPHCPAIIRPNLHQSSNKPSKPGTTISYPFSLTHPEPLILAPVACRTGCWGGPRPMPRMMRPGHHFCCGKIGMSFHHPWIPPFEWSNIAGPFFPSGSGSRVPEPEVLHREDWIG